MKLLAMQTTSNQSRSSCCAGVESMRRLKSRSIPIDLLDGDLLGGSGAGLGNHNRQDAVLEASLDGVLVHVRREGKGALEFADGALSRPVAVGRLVGLLVGTLALGDGLVAFAFSLGLGVVVFALGTALHDQSLRVGELDVDVLLSNSGQFAIQVIGVAALTNIEAGTEGAHGGLLAAGAVDIIVVQKAEEGREIAGGREAGAEERHFEY